MIFNKKISVYSTFGIHFIINSRILVNDKSWNDQMISQWTVNEAAAFSSIF